MAGGIVLFIEFLCGAATGIAVGRSVRSFSWGWAADGLVGGIGGLLFTWPSSRIPGIGRFIGHLEEGLTPTMLVGAGIAGVLGGFILMLLAGFFRGLMRG